MGRALPNQSSLFKRGAPCSSGMTEFHDFGNRQAAGVLFKLQSIPNSVAERVTQYVQNGMMQRDKRFADDVMACMNSTVNPC